MATLAVPSEAELTQLSKNDLIGVVQRAVTKLQSQRARLRKMADSAKSMAKSGALGSGSTTGPRARSSPSYASAARPRGSTARPWGASPRTISLPSPARSAIPCRPRLRTRSRCR